MLRLVSYCGDSKRGNACASDGLFSLSTVDNAFSLSATAIASLEASCQVGVLLLASITFAPAVTPAPNHIQLEITGVIVSG